MWNLYSTAKTFGSRPSEMMHIYDQWAAYCFDDAVGLWGLHVENLLSQHDNKGNPKHNIEEILSDVPNTQKVKSYLDRLGSSFKNISIVKAK